MTAKLKRVELVNYKTIGAYAGYGEGRTYEAALADALRQVQGKDHYINYGTEADGTRVPTSVWFDGGINC